MGAAASSLGLMAGPILRFEPLSAAESASMRPSDANGERVAVSAGSFYRPYRSQHAESADASTWAQIDLGSSRTIDTVRLHPSNWHSLAGDGFPLRFRIDCSDDPDFKTRRLFADRSRSDYPDPNDQVAEFHAKQEGRYVRLTVSRLRKKKLPEPVSRALSEAPEAIRKEVEPTLGFHLFALSKIEVLSAGADLAVLRPVKVDADYGNEGDAQQLTRPSRPQGEGIITNHPRNVTAPGDWRPATYLVQGPLRVSS